MFDRLTHRCEKSEVEGLRFASNRDRTNFIDYAMKTTGYVLPRAGSLLDAILQPRAPSPFG
jgi:hypothetical protein